MQGAGNDLSAFCGLRKRSGALAKAGALFHGRRRRSKKMLGYVTMGTDDLERAREFMLRCWVRSVQVN
jgi:hypothetical protein